MNAFAPNAFSGALDDLFADPNIARTATYQPGGAGEGIPIRIIARRPDREVEFGDVSIVSATAVFEVRVAEVPAPVAGDAIVMDGETYLVQGEPRRDTEHLIWVLDTRPA